MKPCGRVMRFALALSVALILGLLWSASIHGGVRSRTSALPSAKLGQVSEPPGTIIDPALEPLLADGDTEPLRVIVRLRSRSDAEGMGGVSQPNATDTKAWIETRRTELSRLREGIAAILEGAATSGALQEERPLWIVQSLALRGSPALIRRLIAAPEVAGVWLDHYRSYVEPITGSVEITHNTVTSSWGVMTIRAPEVWQTLGISGTGAVVAIMDTGVEYLHPALADQYRGRFRAGRFTHEIGWYDAVNGGVYPYDDHGHGTHVAGSAVGAGTIGVAPGAQWMGVKVLNSAGSGYESWILEGFQWLLAPGGDPDLAPDIVNASWSSQNSHSTLFEESVHTLQEAGIFPVFASGNSGPFPGSVGSPASNRGVFAVGATDADDEVTRFSGRGPSPWDEIKPQVVAPGASIVSSAPGGIYMAKTGTSMASPHVAGLAALLRAVSPTLPVDVLAHVITETARPLTVTVPNNDSGWGRVDAYAAALVVARPSLITGTVTRQSGTPLAGAEVEAVPIDTVPVSGRPNRVVSKPDGTYRMAVVPGLYDLRARGFGYAADRVDRVRVLTRTVQQVDFQLTAYPTGTLAGHVLISGTTQPPTLPLRARMLSKPLSTTVKASGHFTLSAPAGTYTIELRGNGYQVVTAAAVLTVGETTPLAMQVESAPQLLLVDEGTAYYASEVALWREALDTLRYEYDFYKIKAGHALISQTLLPYDVVLWSSPYGSPGLVSSSSALRGYLNQGGKLLLSGQDVAYYDGGGTAVGPGVRPYLYDLLGVFYQSEWTQSEVIGDGPFAGLRVSIQGPGGADNQNAPDTIRTPSSPAPSRIWRYGDGALAGAATSLCVPFRSLFFGFGYEAIVGEAHRLSVMDRSLDWLMTPPLTAGLSLEPLGPMVQIGHPGERVTHTFRIRHLGVAGSTDTLTLAVDGSAWPTRLSPTQARLSPCRTLTATLVVTIPGGVGVDARAVTTVEIHSALQPARQALTFTSKTPAPVLLVDDDRWYPMEEYYTRALHAAGVPYDLWDTKHSLGGIPGERSPATETLTSYPFVIWFTGYDWFAPVRDEEAERLAAYLDRGGRLLLTSQSFLMYHVEDRLAQALGIDTVDWTYEPTEAAGVSEHPAGGGWGPVALNYPYQNWSYAVEPEPAAETIIRGQVGQPLAIAARAPDAGRRPHSLFYAFPLETLPAETRVEVLERGIGWLSPLGDSEWSITPETAQPGEVLTFSLTLRNRASESLDVRMTHVLPSGLSLSFPLDGGLEYNAATRHLTWEGTLASRERLPLTWRAQWLDGSGHGVTGTVELAMPARKLAFEREAACCRPSADLGASHWLTPEGDLRVRTPVTLPFALVNESAYDLNAGQVSVWVMRGGAPLTATLPLTHGWHAILWEGALPAGTSRTLTLPVQGWDWTRPFRVDALLQSEAGRRWESSYWVNVTPWTRYLPLVFRTYR